MKTIGLIGGLSWESSIEYYRLINEMVKERLGGLHSAKSVMYSFDFEGIEALQHQGRWAEATEQMIAAGVALAAAGADMVLICSNTMHLMAEEMEAALQIPLLHIADATGERIRAQGLKRVGLLGTRFTMEGDFYRKRLTQRYGLDVFVPDEEERQMIHDVVYKELCLGVLQPVSRERYKDVIRTLVHEGAEGVILGCTEIPLLIKQEDSEVPLFDTTRIHAEAAVEAALAL